MSKNDKRKLMVNLSCVEKLKWNSDLGKRLQYLRGDVSMRSLALKVGERGFRCSFQYIHKLEDGRAESVSTDLILAICNALEIDFTKLFPGVYIDISELLQKDVA